MLREFVQARLAHVGNVNVTHLAVGLLAHFIDVLLHPRAIIERRLIRDRHHGYVSRAIISRFRVNPQDHLLVGRANKGVVDVRERTNRRAIHGQDVIALLHVHADGSERRTRVLVPVFARQDLLDLVSLTGWIPG